MAGPGSDDPTIPAQARIHTATPPPGSPAGGGAAVAGGARLAPATVISRYRIESVLGEGGMGVVYLARQERPDRQVALKVIRPGFANARMLRRFEHEAEVLGRLLHPGIAQIYEAGTADAGLGPQPFFAMELVRGVPLSEYANQKELTTRQRLELMSRVCDAVEHAHQKGVIHRDLKPGNILVTEEGQPKILDFGVARATDSDLQQTTMQTDVGALIGTLPYMSPEQVGGDPSELDTRSDVYALGVILFELLARRLPYSLERRMIHEAARIIREEDPTRLSSLNKTLRGDVETIVSHALEKDKSRRYQTASALGADLRRYLAHEPITARPASTWYQLSKFSRRNRALVGGVAATFVVLVLGLIVSLYAFAEARYQSGLKDDALGLALENETKAKEEAERARQAQEAEKERADELDKVAKFQAAQFEGLDTQLMGIRLRQDMIADAVAAMEKAKLPAEEVTTAKSQLEETLARGNPTNVALKSLYDNIFARALKAVDEQFADQPEVKARLLQSICDVLLSLGLYEAAVDPQRRAIEIRRHVLGEAHEGTLSSINNLGNLFAKLGRLPEAEPLFIAALEGYRSTLGDDHPGTLAVINNLGNLRQDQGRLEDAEVYFRQGLEISRRLEADNGKDEVIFASLNNMGRVLQAQGRSAEAEPYTREAIEKGRLVFGDAHAGTLTATNNLGITLWWQGKLTEAERYIADVLEKRRRALGDDHPDTLVSISTLGDLLVDQGKLTDAEPYLREALERCRRILGEEHSQTLMAVSNLGQLLTVRGELSAAEPYVREALDKCRRLRGNSHPETIAAIISLAFLLEKQGRLSDAEPLLNEALGTSRRVLGDEHGTTLMAINNMGHLLKELGKLTEAEPYLREALETSRRVIGEEHPNTLGSINNMGSLLRDQGKLAEAEPYFREVVEKCRRVLGDAHFNTLIAINNMGGLLQTQGRFSEAEPYLRESVVGFERQLGLTAWQTGNSRCALGFVLTELSRFAESEVQLLEAERALRTAQGVPPARRRECLEGLIKLYEKWHAAEPGKGYDAKAAEWRAKLEELQAATRPAAQPSTSPATQPAPTGDPGAPGAPPATQPASRPAA